MPGIKTFTLDKEKYIAIARSEGVNAALTALHQDTNHWEIETFEGEKGFQPQMFQDMIEVRNFSRELWDLSLQQQG
jgi:hypothetical protein